MSLTSIKRRYLIVYLLFLLLLLIMLLSCCIATDWWIVSYKNNVTVQIGLWKSCYTKGIIVRICRKYPENNSNTHITGT